MDRNPYSAPRSVVADPQMLAGKRPVAVTAAVLLLAVIILLSLWEVIGLIQAANVGEASFVALVWRVIRLAFEIVLCVGIARGRNWARYTQTALIVIGVAIRALDYWSMTTQMPPDISFMTDPLQLARWLLPSAFGIAVLFLLFGPGRKWFATAPAR